MITVSTQQVVETLDDLLVQVQNGEEVIIHNNQGQAVARLAPPALAARVPGLDAGTVKIAHDFNAPLPDEIVSAFEAAL